MVSSISAIAVADSGVPPGPAAATGSSGGIATGPAAIPPGIPASERELVLQPFYRILGTNVDGSGLGLAIVQEIAQQHGATLHMEDAHPERSRPGLRVSIRFAPRAESAE